MKFLERIRAIFNFKGQRAEMKLESAEIRGNRVYLHPADDPAHIFCVSGKAVDVLIDLSEELTEADFFVIENEKANKLQQQMEIDPTSPIEKLLQPKTPPEEKQHPKAKESPKQNPETKSESEIETKATPTPSEKKAGERSVASNPNITYTYERPQMRTVSMKLYQDEYDFLMATIEANGYKKTEFLLACVTAAKKKSMETNYQKYYAERLRRRREQREAAAKARAEQAQANPQNQVSA